jgi:3-methyladenine DNA glycosylase AlkD
MSRRSERIAQKRSAAPENSEETEVSTPSPHKRAQANMSSFALTKRISDSIWQFANPTKAEGMKKYMRNQFDFVGLMSPQRKECVKELLGEFPDPSLHCDQFEAAAKDIWKLPEREFQYVIAVDLLPKVARKLPFKCVDGICKELLTDRSWWDTVDALACSVVGPIVLKNREEGTKIMKAWIKHENLWLRRAALLHQNAYKNQVDQELLFEFVLETMHEKDEFFIQKAIGWSLRSYARVNSEAVKKFVLEHQNNMSSLSFKEATKHIPL